MPEVLGKVDAHLDELVDTRAVADVDLDERFLLLHGRDRELLGHRERGARRIEGDDARRQKYDQGDDPGTTPNSAHLRIPFATSVRA